MSAAGSTLFCSHRTASEYCCNTELQMGTAGCSVPTRSPVPVQQEDPVSGSGAGWETLRGMGLLQWGPWSQLRWLNSRWIVTTRIWNVYFSGKVLPKFVLSWQYLLLALCGCTQWCIVQWDEGHTSGHIHYWASRDCQAINSLLQCNGSFEIMGSFEETMGNYILKALVYTEMLSLCRCIAECTVLTARFGGTGNEHHLSRIMSSAWFLLWHFSGNMSLFATRPLCTQHRQPGLCMCLYMGFSYMSLASHSTKHFYLLLIVSSSAGSPPSPAVPGWSHGGIFHIAQPSSWGCWESFSPECCAPYSSAICLMEPVLF